MSVLRLKCTLFVKGFGIEIIAQFVLHAKQPKMTNTRDVTAIYPNLPTFELPGLNRYTQHTFLRETFSARRQNDRGRNSNAAEYRCTS